MSKIKPKRAYAKEIFNSFGGIGAAGEFSPKGAAEMRNFRILADGSLEKRNGWKVQANFPDRVRGVWQGSLNGTSECFVAAGDTVYRMDESSLSALGELPERRGRVRFVLYHERLYLLDGTAVRVYRAETDSFEEAYGYAPLYGRNWHPTDYGDVNEPLNLFTNRLRVHYFNTTGSTVFMLPYYAESIDKVRVDGIEMTDYSFSSPGDKVTLSTVGSSVEIAFTILMGSDHRTRLSECSRAFADRAGEREYLLMCGGNEEQYLYCTAQVSDSMLNSCRVMYGDTDPLYCTTDGILLVGDTDRPVTSFVRDRGRILAFHKDGASSISVAEEGNGVEYYPLLRGVGCSEVDMDLTVDGDPVVFNVGGIFRLTSTASEPDDFHSETLAERLPLLQDESTFGNVISYADIAHGELWFRNSQEMEEGLVWVLNTVQKQWYLFDGICAEFFCTLNGAAGFAWENQLCVFDESSTTDNGATFEAFYQSGYLCFSSPEEVKRSLRISLCGSNVGSNCALEIESEKKMKIFSITGKDQTAPICFDLRATLGRFRFLRFCLRDNGNKRSRWFRTALYTNR